MRLYSDSLGLSDSAFTLLRDLIHERTGLYYDNGRRDVLADKLAACVIERGFDSFLDYYYLLKYDQAAVQEWDRVLDALSVPETFFWREVDQVHALVNVLLPQFEQSGGRPVRIWSAACATGEEPLTLALALNEAGWFERLAIEIYASDASQAALAAARRGVFRERSFRNLAPALREQYFTALPARSAGGPPAGWQIAPALHRRVTWHQANLLDPAALAPLACASVIFCRNVFIYFSDSAIERVAQRFYEHMRAPGYLFLGASESLLRFRTEFVLQEVGGVFAYVKPAGA